MTRTRLDVGWPVGRILAIGLLVVSALTWVSRPAAAQDSDFLYEAPRFTFAFHGGFHLADASSDVFDFTTDNLTVERSDFDSPAFRAELSFRAVDRLDLSVDVAWSTSETRSESRDFIGSDDLPIVQTTTFSQTPVSLNAKYFLLDRGRRVGNLAWIPRRVSAYVGGGIGLASYSFVQEGEFVIEETLEIVEARFDSSTTGRLIQVLAGMEFTITPRAIVLVDGRYRWASARMRNDWVDFEDIDLSGLSFSLGLGVRL